MERLSALGGQVVKNKNLLIKNQVIRAEKNVFGHLALAPPDPILGTTLAYKADKDPKKINLGNSLIIFY